MSRWVVHVERGGSFLGYVDAPDRDGAMVAALGKFGDATAGLVYVRRIVDVPRDIPIDPTKITRLAEFRPAEEELSPEEMPASPVLFGEEEWRDGSSDDGSLTSDEILPE